MSKIRVAQDLKELRLQTVTPDIYRDRRSALNAALMLAQALMRRDPSLSEDDLPDLESSLALAASRH